MEGDLLMRTKHIEVSRGVRGGFGIVEAMVALLLFGVFIAGACRLIVTARETASRATDHYTAIALAKSRIERIQTFSFSQLDMMGQSNEPLNENGDPVPTGDARFRMSTVVSAVTTNLKMVRVTMDIKDRFTLQFDGENEVITAMISEQKIITL
jgi:Tfp pilus assembly protein PilV